MHIGLVQPTDEEVTQVMLNILRHSFHVEYYVALLEVHSPEDTERPHDLEGLFSKFDLDVLERLALEYRKQTPEINARFLEGINLHRQQYHHRMWNSEEAPIGAMQLGAIDAICSRLETRIIIRGGSHNGNYSLDDDKIDSSLRGSSKQIFYLRWALAEMRKIPRQNLNAITSLECVPNLGVPTSMYFRVIDGLSETIEAAEQKGYIILTRKLKQIA